MIHRFDQDIYPFKLWIVYRPNPDRVTELLAYTDNSPLFREHIKDCRVASTFEVYDKGSNDFGVLIVFKNKALATPEYMAHEACHAAKFVFERISADIVIHEPFEYLLQWIVKCCVIAKKHR